MIKLHCMYYITYATDFPSRYYIMVAPIYSNAVKALVARSQDRSLEPAHDNGYHISMFVLGSCSVPCPRILCAQVYLVVHKTSPSQQKAARISDTDDCAASTGSQ